MAQQERRTELRTCCRSGLGCGRVSPRERRYSCSRRLRSFTCKHSSQGAKQGTVMKRVLKQSESVHRRYGTALRMACSQPRMRCTHNRCQTPGIALLTCW